MIGGSNATYLNRSISRTDRRPTPMNLGNDSGRSLRTLSPHSLQYVNALSLSYYNGRVCISTRLIKTLVTCERRPNIQRLDSGATRRKRQGVKRNAKIITPRTKAAIWIIAFSLRVISSTVTHGATVRQTVPYVV
jgi:hypothetical protein